MKNAAQINYEDQTHYAIDTMPVNRRILNDLIDLLSSKSEPEKTNQIRNLIEFDPVLTVRFLSLANSSFYGLSRYIDSIAVAYTVVGKAIALELFKKLQQNNESIPKQYYEIYLHSVLVSKYAELLATNCAFSIGKAKIAGLIHDIGIFYKIANPDLKNTDHGIVGYELIEQMQLPQIYADVIKNHHNRHVNSSRLFSLVRIANQLAYYVRNSDDHYDEAELNDRCVWDLAELDFRQVVLQLDKIDEIHQQTAKQVAEIF